jgi:hypothetical protein
VQRVNVLLTFFGTTAALLCVLTSLSGECFCLQRVAAVAGNACWQVPAVARRSAAAHAQVAMHNQTAAVRADLAAQMWCTARTRR